MYIEERKNQFDNVYMNIAKEIATLSHCTRAKVGAVLVDENYNIISYGFNGTPKGFDNVGEHLVDGKLVTKDEVLHAESNAITKIAKSNNSSVDSTIYVTLSPCLNCAKLIIQSGIKEVVYLEKYRDTSGIDFLKESGLNIRKL
jgi:dCMP deaminase